MARRIDPDTQWHLDKKVPVAIVLTLLIQTVSIVWWAAGVTKDVSVLGREITEIKGRTQKLDNINVLEAEIRNVRESMTRIEGTLGRLLEHRLVDRQQSLKGK